MPLIRKQPIHGPPLNFRASNCAHAEDDYVIIEKIGETYFIKKLHGEKQLLARVRAKVKKSGITRERLREIVEEETQATCKTMRSLQFP